MKMRSDLFNNVLDVFGGSLLAYPRYTLSERLWTSTYNVKYLDDSTELYVEVPGIEPETIDVSVENYVLSVKGSGKIGDKEIKLSNQLNIATKYDSSLVTADVKNGVLTIKLPIKKTGTTGKVKVQVKS
jgi:HSP20 family molecular chaperone IbpA